MMALGCIPGMRPPSPFIFARTFARVVVPTAGDRTMLDTVTRKSAAPFDTARLDRLMDEAGLDVLVATSKHNVQYLLGGHRSFFFENMDAMGLSRYLPVFVYPKGRSGEGRLFRPPHGDVSRRVKPFWVAEVSTKSGGSVDVMEKAADYARKLNHEATTRRRRARLPAGRFHCRAAQGVSGRRASRTRCSCSSGCAPSRRRKNWKCCASRPSGDRFHARGDREAMAPAPPRPN